ncbi:MAG TPA: hypothetical protein VIM29_06515 [Bacillota bacterium]
MKKLFSLVLACCLTLGLSGAVWAVQKPSLSTEILDLLDDYINVQYEMPRDKESSWVIGGGVADYGVYDLDVTMIGIYGGYRKYINNVFKYQAKPLEGFYAEGKAGLAFVDTNYAGDDTNVFLGGEFGYKHQFDGGFMLEGGLDICYFSGDDRGDYESGTDVDLTLRLGYTW